MKRNSKRIMKKSSAFKVKYSTSVGQYKFYFPTLIKAFKHMKKFRKGEFTADPLYFRKKNKKGSYVWKLKGYYGYSIRSGKFIKKR